MKNIIQLAKEVEDRERLLEESIGKLAIELQKYVDFGTVIVDVLQGDGIGIGIEGEDEVHVKVSTFLSLIKDGKVNREDFFEKAYF